MSLFFKSYFGISPIRSFLSGSVFTVIIAVAVTLLPSSSAFAAMPDVQVKGLFSGRAMLSINGQVKLMRAGEVSEEGVTLVSADSNEATIEFEGATHRLGLSQQIGASFVEPKETEVRLSSSRGGHYLTRANINGRLIEVMVDTGATLIAMNSSHARQLGIRLDDATNGYASTASGVVPTRMLMLNSVSIGGITRTQVAASVIEGDFPEIILLGNSFLSGVDVRFESGVMVMTSKF